MGATGLFYIRFMDDILVLAPTRWKLRRAAAAVNQILAAPIQPIRDSANLFATPSRPLPTLARSSITSPPVRRRARGGFRPAFSWRRGPMPSARGEATEADVDVLVRLTPDAAQGGFAYFAGLDALVRRLHDLLGCPVDVIAEPVRKERLRRSIEKDAMLAF
jgi:predicted nucleotidyltransferase